MIILSIISLLAVIGVWDSWYLTSLHYSGFLPPCHATFRFIDCGEVLRSQYSIVFGIPLALLGVIHYTIVLVLSILSVSVPKRVRSVLTALLLVELAGGITASAYFVYLMVFVIGKVCTYCFLSAGISLMAFVIAVLTFPNERQKIITTLMRLLYVGIMKPVLFRFEAESVHESMVSFGQLLGRVPITRSVLAFSLKHEDRRLSQTIAGIEFPNPIGLAAGFDYDAKLTQVLPAIGFGFQTVGTVTNIPYAGNPRPLLGRLPKSKSLMVNKGFKSLGAQTIRLRMERLSFEYPVGISIGRSNSRLLRNERESIQDICTAFSEFERSTTGHKYYELNISCPNLFGNISFYRPQKLRELVRELNALNISKPVFVKMPIELSNPEFLNLLRVLSPSFITGVIIGNLQKNRSDPSLDPGEVSHFQVGSFSGKPTWERSNALIRLTKQTYRDRYIIIGCGGVFSAEDAYIKMALGASLIQLITGMVYEGPQLVNTILAGLSARLDKEHASELSALFPHAGV